MEYEIKVLSVDGRRPFSNWFDAIRDPHARDRIRSRLRRIRDGNLGDSRSVGDGVHELRVDYGPGYRVYFAISQSTLIVLLCGGDKSTQGKDILSAKRLWREYKDDTDRFQ